MRTILLAVRDLSPEAFLVGGAIRDALTGRSYPVDLDLIVKGDGFHVARTLVDRLPHEATFVPLDAERGAGRIVVRRGEAIVDISSLQGDSLAEDLRKRDFTINALAVKLEDLLNSGIERLIDPMDGRLDLQRGKLRACSAQTFDDDPVRMIRAFRFQAELGFEICHTTLEMIRSAAQGVQHAAPERIRDELVGVFRAKQCEYSLRDMDRCGILGSLFPELVAMKGVGQNEYHHLDVWDHSIEAVRQLEILLEDQATTFGDAALTVRAYVDEELVRGRPRSALLKFAALFHDTGKPHCISRDPDGRVRFLGHEKISREIFEQAGRRLKLANREIHVIGEWIGGHMRPMILTGSTVSKRALYRLHRTFGVDVIGLLLLFLADLGASSGPARPENIRAHALAQTNRAMKALIESAQEPQQPLLNGHDIMRMFGLTPGPFLGRVVKRLAELEGSGEVRTREEAVGAVRHYIGTARREQEEHH
ncbi:MAG: HD domain-containing protein [Deltaproteobacteria bacterium]